MPAPAYRLPTPEESARLIAEARRMRAETVAAAFRRIAAWLSAPWRAAGRAARA